MALCISVRNLKTFNKRKRKSAYLSKERFVSLTPFTVHYTDIWDREGRLSNILLNKMFPPILQVFEALRRNLGWKFVEN